MVKISTSILGSTNIKNTIEKLNNTDTDYLHIDVMDGKFVKEKSLVFSKIKDLLKDTKKPLDVHLMVDNPNKLIEEYALLNTEIITIHIEIKKDILKYIEKIKGYGIKCGISIKPNTPISFIIDILDKVDVVLIMGVTPGYSGQEFIESSLDKISELKQEIINRNLNVQIEVDGGINKETSALCIEKGADILVSSSYIINFDDFQSKIDDLRTN